MSELTKFLIFATIGLGNSVLDIFIWKFLVKVIQSKPKFNSFVNKIKLTSYSFAHSISFVITVISSYFLNKNFTFGSKAIGVNQTTLEATKFFGVAIFSWILTTVFLTYLTKSQKIQSLVQALGRMESKATGRASLIVTHWPLIAKILTIVVSMISNYTGYRLFVFKA